MFKHNIDYVDFNGTERNEDFYFHLSSVEVTRLEAEIGRDLNTHIKELTANQDMKTLLDFLERILLGAYGRKTSDGKSFIKNKDLRTEFEYSNAYAEIFEQMLTNPDLAKKFGEAVADNGKSKKNQVQPTVVNN
jgi:hypothetical protein